MLLRHYVTSVNIKKFSWLVGYRMWGSCRWRIIYSLFSQQLEELNLSQDYVFMKHMWMKLNYIPVLNVSTPVQWLTTTHSPQNIRFIRAGAVPEHRITTPRTKDISAINCNSRFSNIDGDKEVKVTDCRFKFCFVFVILFFNISLKKNFFFSFRPSNFNTSTYFN